jgi:hypothetical protein
MTDQIWAGIYSDKLAAQSKYDTAVFAKQAALDTANQADQAWVSAKKVLINNENGCLDSYQATIEAKKVCNKAFHIKIAAQSVLDTAVAFLMEATTTLETANAKWHAATSTSTPRHFLAERSDNEHQPPNWSWQNT